MRDRCGVCFKRWRWSLPRTKEIAVITLDCSPEYARFVYLGLSRAIPDFPRYQGGRLVVVLRGFANSESDRLIGATVQVVENGAILHNIAALEGETPNDGRSAYRWLWDTLEALLPDELYRFLKSGYAARQKQRFDTWKHGKRSVRNG